MIKAALFDVDGTLVDGRVWGGIIKNPAVSRLRVRWLYTRTMPKLVYLKLNPGAETRFRDHWVRGLAELLRRWPESEVKALAHWIANEYLVPMYRDDVIEVLQKHKRQGHKVILVSTMFPVVLEEIASRVGADAWVGTKYAVENGELTGEISGQSCVGPRKLDFTVDYLARHTPDIRLDNCAAYADSFSDIPLLEAVPQPVAVYPDERLAFVARKRGWHILPES